MPKIIKMNDKTYKIELADKAAFINHLNKLDVDVSSYEIIDNKYEGYFEITFINPEDIDIVKTILHDFPKMTQIKEALRKMVREELQRKYK
jgi:hypothetical protein